MQKMRLVMTAASIALASMLAQPVHAAPPQAAQAAADQTKVHDIKAALRDLWIGHVFWVRNVVVAELAGNAAAQKEAEKQVVENAQGSTEA